MEFLKKVNPACLVKALFANPGSLYGAGGY